MTPDAALDSFAYLVGLHLMGPDAKRRLHIALLRSPNVEMPNLGQLHNLERLDALVEGQRPVQTLQDRLDLARAEHDRNAPPFDPAFWFARLADLMRAGFDHQRAAELIQNVRARVDPPQPGESHDPQFEA